MIMIYKPSPRGLIRILFMLHNTDNDVILNTADEALREGFTIVY